PHHGRTTLPHHGRMVEDPHSIPGRAVPAATCTHCHADPFTKQIEESMRTAQKMPSLWGQTRRELRGVKEERKPAAAKKKELEVCGPGTVGEAVLKMLAESGHHFSHLTENETLTVVITFRGGEEPQRPKAHDPAQAPPQKPATSSTSTSSATVEKKAEPSSARDYELLGDLHLKQGRAQEAVS